MEKTGEFKLLGPANASHGHVPLEYLARRDQKWQRKNKVIARGHEQRRKVPG